MKTIIKGFLMISLIIPFFSQGQQAENVFLERDFWSTNPSLDVIKEKVAAGNDPLQFDSHSFNATAYAILNDQPLTTIKYFLSLEGNSINTLTHDGRIYLHWAAMKPNLEVIRYLVEQGSKPETLDAHGYTVLNFAATTGQTNPEVYDFLLANGSRLTETNREGANALLLLIPHLKDFSMVNYFTRKGLSLNSVDNNGNGAFFYAAKGGSIPLMDLLIAKKMDYKGVNQKGENAILVAAIGQRRSSNSVEVFEYLSKKGIKSNVTANDGMTPLLALAGKTRDPEVIQFFLDKGVKADQADNSGEIPLMVAAQRNDLEIVRLLAKNTSDMNIRNNKGQTALMNAVRGNNPDVVNFLISEGADVSPRDLDGNNVGFYLMESYRPEGEHGGFGGPPNRTKDPFSEKLTLLTQAGFDVKSTQKDEATLLHLAAEKNDLKLIKMVVALGVNVNQADKNGTTPLQIAAMKASDDHILKYFLSIGADKAVKTAFDETAYDLAQENELLQAAGIDVHFLQ